MFKLIRTGVTSKKFMDNLGQLARTKQANGDGESERLSITLCYLRELMGKERGLFLKVGQMLWDTPTLHEFENIHTVRVPGIDQERLQAMIKKDSGKEWFELFREISPESHRASLAQVQSAVLNDGRKIALKVQYPDIREKISAQLQLLRILPQGLVKKWAGKASQARPDFRRFQSLLERVIKSELSLRLEKANHRMVSAFAKELGPKLQDGHQILVPELLPLFEDSDSLFAMEYMEGQSLTRVRLSWDACQKLQAATAMATFFLHSLFSLGKIQGDYNSGNFLFRKTAELKVELVLLDFGQLFEIPLPIRRGLAELCHLLRRQELDHSRAHTIFLEMGFNRGELAPLEDRLHLVAQVLLAPLTAPGRFNLVDWSPQKQLNQLLGEARPHLWNSCPVEFFMLIKAFIGLKEILGQLGAEISFPEILAACHEFSEWESQYAMGGI